MMTSQGAQLTNTVKNEHRDIIYVVKDTTQNTQLQSILLSENTGKALYTYGVEGTINYIF